MLVTLNAGWVALSIILSPIAIIVAGTQVYCQPGYRPNGLNYEFDLSPMNREFIMELHSITKPSTKITRTVINICNPVVKPPITYDEDFCKPNTYVCFRLYHKRGDVERLDEVEELAGDYEGAKLSPELKAISGNQDLSSDGSQVLLTLHGEKVENKTQTVEITLECSHNESKDNPSGPSLISNENLLTKLHWKVAFACATKSSQEDREPPLQDDKSIVGWFFTILGVLLALYFIAGIAYSFKMYNARGLDLIPHRNFCQDMISQVMSSITAQRRGKNGYVSV